VEAHLDPASGVDKSWRRNASLAWVKLSFERISPFPNSDATSFSPESRSHEISANFGRVSIVVKYLQQYGDASTAYNDLRPFVEQLDIQERKQLISTLDKIAICREENKSKNDSQIRDDSVPFHQDVS
jgi:N-terminal acetyltransferase B complex non-catalytic subunit